jgi:Tol biopolymer transport system component
VRLLAGGAPLQITSDDGDHEHPRWTADGTGIIYFSKSSSEEDSGTLFEVSALGGPARPLMAAANGADVSHDGRRLALFQVRHGVAYLVTVSRDDGRVEDVAAGLRGYSCESPRWSPDDRWIAFHARRIGQFHERLYVADASGLGEPQPVARAAALTGASWLPDSSGLVYSSSAGSALPYPPTFNLRVVGRDGAGDRAITFGDMSYVEPDVHASGKILACRIRAQSDIWRFPTTGSPAENTSQAVRITRQSGQVQAPSVSPDGSEVVYLSDSGGHANLWVAKTDGSGRARQITFQQHASTMAVPIWSPVDNRIVFVQSGDVLTLWIVHSDGRGLRHLVSGSAACWSPDGAWIYYSPLADNEQWHIEKIPASGGSAVIVRDDNNSFAPSVGRSALYYAVRIHPSLGRWDWEYRRVRPDAVEPEPLARVAGSRIPVSALFAPMSLSPDERWFARPLIDGATCNIFVLSADGGRFEPVTDFGDRPNMIARQVSWSPDSASLYAAVAEINADIVLLDGLI